MWPNDGLPGQICARCASKLHIAFQLKKQCEKSDLKLRQYKAISRHKQLKVTDELQPSLNLGENGLPQQVCRFVALIGNNLNSMAFVM